MPKGPFRIAIEDFLSTFGFGDRISDATTNYIKMIEAELRDLIMDIYRDFGIEDVVPDSLRPDTPGGVGRDAPAPIIALAGVALGLVVGILGGGLQPLADMMKFQLDKIIRSARVSPDVAALFMRRFPLDRAHYVQRLKESGWSDIDIDNFERVSHPLLSPQEVLALFLRERLDSQQAVDYLKTIGYSQSDAQHVMTLSELIPPVNDLIRFAVRDAFSPEAVEQFGLMEQFPGEITQYTEKLGLSDFWTRKYWASHWQLPSPTQVFEMLHRLRPGRVSNPFTEDDLDIYLRTADIPVFFRNRMKAISYRPFTRVDVRRMRSMNIIDDNEVYDAYRDIGYDDWRANKLTEFTLADIGKDTRDLTRTAIQQGYYRGIIDRNNAVLILQQLGYDAFESDFWVSLIDWQKEQDDLDIALSRIEILYTEGAIDDLGVNTELGLLDLPATHTSALLLKWTRKKKAKIRLPSRADLESFYRSDIVDVDQFSDGLSNIGYRGSDIPKYTHRQDLLIAKSSVDEAEKARKEQERLRVSDLEDRYKEAKAGYDVDIADVKVAIADIKVALHFVEPKSPDEANLKQRISELKLEIARLNVDKANVTLDFEVEK